MLNTNGETGIANQYVFRSSLRPGKEAIIDGILSQYTPSFYLWQMFGEHFGILSHE